MRRRVQLVLGLSMVLIACAGLLAMTRAFDASASTREVRVAKFRTSWSRTDDGRTALDLGRVQVPRPGIVRVVVCPTPVADPHATLRVRDAAGHRVADEALKEDEARGKRCFDASYHANAAGTYTVSLTVPTPEVAAHVKRADVFASRRITALSAWPVIMLLLGLLTAATAPRRAPGAPEPSVAPTPAFRTATAPGVPAGWVGGIVPPGMLAPGMPSAPPLGPDATEPPPEWVAPPTPPEDTRPLVERPFSPLYAMVAYVAVHVAMTIVAVGFIVVRGGGQHAAETGEFVAFTLLVQHAMLIAIAVLFLGAYRGYDVRGALGILPLSGRQIAQAVGCGLLLIAVAAVSTRLIRDVSTSPMGQMIERVPVRLAIGFGALLAPFSEELFFRGVLVRAFGKRSVVVGVIGSTIVFTGAHAMQLWGAWAGLIPICAVALVNGWLRVKSGGISQPWLVHTIYNGALSAGLYLGG